MKVVNSTRIAVVLVGLPARGKTYIGRKVHRYLEWLGVSCKVFNVGEYRRKNVGSYSGHEFFDANNPIFENIRAQCASEALDDLIRWFGSSHSGVAIYDATNSTLKRRKLVYERCSQNSIDVLFAESWCDDEDLIMNNILEVKRCSPDYAGVTDFTQVIDDFKLRISHYNDVYQQVGIPPDPSKVAPELKDYDETQLTYVRKINVGAQMVINRVKDYMQSRIVFFLMNIHIAPRSILFSRHGESQYNQLGLLGGDSGLSPNGQKYADALPALITKIMGDKKLTVWTSTLKRTIQTAAQLSYKKIQFKALDEINAGLCDGLSYNDVKERYPEEYATRKENKFEFRYRGGESYRDVVLRLEPIIMELERQQNIMIVSHQAVLRCIYAYFLEVSPSELPYIKIPLHTVMKLTWTAYGCEAQMYSLDIKAVDTHITKPKPSPKSEISDSKISIPNNPAASTDSITPLASTPADSQNTLKPSTNDHATSSADADVPKEDISLNRISRKYTLLNKNQRVVKHTAMISFPSTIANNSKLFYDNAISKKASNDLNNFAMEAQPVSSPLNFISTMDRLPSILNSVESQKNSFSQFIKDQDGLPGIDSHRKSSNSKKSALSELSKINSDVKTLGTQLPNSGLNSSPIHDLTITPCNVNDILSIPPNGHPGSKEIYPPGFVISNQATPSVSRSDSPSSIPSSTTSKDKRGLLSSLLSPSNDSFLNESFIQTSTSNTEHDQQIDLNTNSGSVLNERDHPCQQSEQDNYLGSTSRSSIPIIRKSPTGSAELESTGSDKNSSPCSFEKQISRNNSVLGLSIEKIESLHLGGHRNVKFIQTKPALALSFTQPSNMNKLDKTSVIKQGLTGLDKL
ncbi:6-phosphofructo-2-kinase/fructose-2,6-bisphosphatase 2 [Smittium mucronatum]|uniref:fructose-2,6-bisphosphate 2-phosphatase n=1 Tax=Smittium mucronatum TaxID=133383 RepID=A0A1R0H8F1_9FUNG|nr:6-phosphofructo-2-kinase/fructose-2,6-bisphosphatase 2 [Smittium mucronatum]